MAKIAITTRFDEKLKEKLDATAKEDGRSVNSFINQAVAEKIDRLEKDKLIEARKRLKALKGNS